MQVGIDYTGVCVVFLCHDGKGNILLSLRGKNCRDEQGAWDPGGGALEFGDSVEETLRKEIKEEYASDVLDYESLGYMDVHRSLNGKPTHWIALCFLVRVDRKQVKNNEPHKLDAVEWFTLDSLPTPLHSQLPAFLAKYEEKLSVLIKFQG
ncbi:NUDIX domain-containing protein [Candidatus Woesebacteria bacterium]|nr:NUDIX domain-containing protein [Candidatus Woesebacteria bacterium]